MVEMMGLIEYLNILNDDKRCIVMDFLYERPSGSSFKDISKATNISPTALAYHLKHLARTGLVQKEFRNIEGRRDYSFYTATEKGKIIYTMIEAAYRRESMIERGVAGLADHGSLIILPSRIGPRCFTIQPEGEE
ncbi:MAG: ArsR/SmtB family transcription factor [Thermoplasmatota archaeon]